MSCICRDCLGGMSPGPRPRYPKGTSPEATRKAKGSEVKALFSVVGMTCAARAGSVEKEVKRLPGIQEAAVDVLNNTALVLYSTIPASSMEDKICEAIKEAGFEAKLIKLEMNDKTRK